MPGMLEGLKSCTPARRSCRRFMTLHYRHQVACPPTLAADEGVTSA
jgi:hypothetical protein